MPMAATTQSDPAVVSPRTDSPSRMIAPAPPAATPSRSRTCQPESVGMLLARCSNRHVLEAPELLDAARCEVEQLVESRAVERDLLRRRLHLDEPAVPGHDDVQVDIRV